MVSSKTTEIWDGWWILCEAEVYGRRVRLAITVPCESRRHRGADVCREAAATANAVQRLSRLSRRPAGLFACPTEPASARLRNATAAP